MSNPLSAKSCEAFCLSQDVYLKIKRMHPLRDRIPGNLSLWDHFLFKWPKERVSADTKKSVVRRKNVGRRCVGRRPTQRGRISFHFELCLLKTQIKKRKYVVASGVSQCHQLVQSTCSVLKDKFWYKLMKRKVTCVAAGYTVYENWNILG